MDRVNLIVSNMFLAHIPYVSCNREDGFFSYIKKERKKVKLLSSVQLFVNPWTVAYQAPPSMGFSRQEY